MKIRIKIVNRKINDDKNVCKINKGGNKNRKYRIKIINKTNKEKEK